jgi:hypothetical protein
LFLSNTVGIATILHDMTPFDNMFGTGSAVALGDSGEMGTFLFFEAEK